MLTLVPLARLVLLGSGAEAAGAVGVAGLLVQPGRRSSRAAGATQEEQER